MTTRSDWTDVSWLVSDAGLPLLSWRHDGRHVTSLFNNLIAAQNDSHLSLAITGPITLETIV